MTFEVAATYEDGILRPRHPLALPNGAEVQISVSVPEADPLSEVIGIGEGPAAGDAAEHHDDYLYGSPSS